ncbi:MAG: hypothetical protein IKZ30_00190 [Oscillospiraceae bacterium]|nr:hypothetical protein [Oscillospiraceae bacterium]
MAACYAVFAFIITPNIPDSSLCRGVLITVANDNNGNLTDENINEMLKENGLEVMEAIVPISARLVANKSGFKFKGEAIRKLASELGKVV